MNHIDLKGRHAVITGGAQGIGFSIAERMLASGASVSLWDRDAALLQGASESLQKIGKATTEVVDVSDAANVDTAVAHTIEQHGSIDILVSSAGVAGPNFKTWEYPIDAWRQVMEINLTGTFLCCRSIVPGMIERNYGRIVNISSIAGKEGNPTASGYSASKAGVIALTKSLGKETASYNIAVNCITPAAAKTRILEQVSQAHIDFMLSKIPRGRFLKTEEISAMVAWLVSEENSFTTGAVFDLSGGRATY